MTKHKKARVVVDRRFKGKPEIFNVRVGMAAPKRHQYHSRGEAQAVASAHNRVMAKRAKRRAARLKVGGLQYYQ